MVTLPAMQERFSPWVVKTPCRKVWQLTPDTGKEHRRARPLGKLETVPYCHLLAVPSSACLRSERGATPERGATAGWAQRWVSFYF